MVVEKFHRDPSIAPNSDMAERVFTLKQPTCIKVTYHLEPNRITASHRLFLTPPHSQEQGYNLTFDPEAVSGYQVICGITFCGYSVPLCVEQVDPSVPEPKSQDLFQQLESLMAAQDDIISQVWIHHSHSLTPSHSHPHTHPHPHTQVRASEREVAAILGRREEEESAPQLSVSVYDVARNQKAFQQREEEEERAREDERLQREKERDYLAPFLGRLVGDVKELDREQMAAVTEVFVHIK